MLLQMRLRHLLLCEMKSVDQGLSAAAPRPAEKYENKNFGVPTIVPMNQTSTGLQY